MTGDTVGDQLSNAFVTSFRQLDQQLRPGGRMVDANILAVEARLKGGGIFSDIMKQTSRLSRLRTTKPPGARSTSEAGVFVRKPPNF